MRIIDPNGLLPNERILRDVICNHPMDSNLANHLDTVEVFLSERCEIAHERIEPDIENRKVSLGLGRFSKNKANFRYILYHEFCHVADRLNPSFKYSEQLRASLSSSEQMAVMELWNLFIDARLNRHELFELGDQKPCSPKRHGLLLNGIQGKLQRHAVMLENQGVPYSEAMKLAGDCWNNPPEVWTYEEMVTWVRKNSPPSNSNGSR